MADAPKPIAQGNLAKTPLLHLLLSIVQRKLTGTLAVWPGNGQRGQDRVYFVEGHAKKAWLLTETTDFERGLLTLFSRQEVPYAFYDQDLVPDANATGHVDTHALGVASLRGRVDQRLVDVTLSNWGGRKLRLKRGASVDTWELLKREQAVIELLLASPMTIEELERDAPNPKVAQRMAYWLTLNRAVEAYQGPAIQSGERDVSSRTNSPPQETARPSLRPPEPDRPPMPPPNLPEEHMIAWHELVDFAENMDEMTYFQMFGVSLSASADTIEDSYLQLLKKWHVDRLPLPLKILRPWSERIMQNLTEGKKLLLDPKKRMAYENAVNSGGGTPKADRALSAILNAAMEYQKVEVLARRRHWDEALSVLELVIEANADEPDYHAMHAHLLFQKHGVENEAHVVSMLEYVDRALEIDSDHEHGTVTKAHILKRLGRGTEAIALFRKVAHLYPKNIDAVREVRLAEMRSRSGSVGRTSLPPRKKKQGEDDGLFSKLFGKKK